MQTYKRRALHTILIGIVGVAFGGVAAVIVGGFFIDDQTVLIAVTAAVCAVILLATILSESIAFTITPEGQFAYFKYGKIQHYFDLKHCYVGYFSKTSDTIDRNISLRILPEGKDETDMVFIDASPLGKKRFEKMFAQMEKFSLNRPKDIEPV